MEDIHEDLPGPSAKALGKRRAIESPIGDSTDKVRPSNWRVDFHLRI